MVGVAEKYLRKGSKVYVEGQLETRKWQDRDGNDRYSTEVVLRPYRSELVLLGEKQDNGSQDRRSDHQGRESTGEMPDNRPLGVGGGLPDDEIPFIMEWRG